MKLEQTQLTIINAPRDSKTFLSGPAGCGKTTAGVGRLRALLEAGVSASSILILTPQRTLQGPYESALSAPNISPGGQVALATVGGLARRMVDLFWPLVGEMAGFSHPDEPPIFLTLETAQYYMARIVRPLLDEGLFASVTIDRNRLYSQVLDNLNKAATVGFSHTEIGERLSAAWLGDPGQRRVYEDAQASASRFRKYCLEHSLLDFSLQMEIFWNFLWQTQECHTFLTRQYHHLIYDNIEEDTPVAHDLVLDWLPDIDSALIIFDSEGGYRRFLGADPESAERLAAKCSEKNELNQSFVTTQEIQELEAAFTSKFLPDHSTQLTRNSLNSLIFPPKETPTRYFPQMLEWVAVEIQQLINKEGLSPSEIVVLAPYLPDALRFALSNRLEELQIPWRSHRPSRSLRDEPASACLLTLAELAHPDWNIHPTKFDMAHAFMFAFEGMDLVRAQLLAEIVYRTRDISLSSFSAIQTEMQERITFTYGMQYEKLREWIKTYVEQPDPVPLDLFLRRLFGEILSQKGFGFHRNNDAARTAASLVDSVQKFRQVMEPANFNDGGSGTGTLCNNLELGKEYIGMLQDGVIAAQYIEAWQAA